MAAIGSKAQETGWVRYTPQVIVACCVALAALVTLTVALSSWANVKIACMHGSQQIISHSPYTIILPGILIALCAIAARVLWVDKTSDAPKEHIAPLAVESMSTPIAPALFVPLETTQTSPFTGSCTRLFVQTGDLVARGAPICILEVMKMETTICSHEAGTVTELYIQAGVIANQNDRLFTIRPDRREFPDP